MCAYTQTHIQKVRLCCREIFPTVQKENSTVSLRRGLEGEEPIISRGKKNIRQWGKVVRGFEKENDVHGREVRAESRDGVQWNPKCALLYYKVRSSF